MWQVLKILTDDRPSNNTYIITGNGRACVSQRQKANAFVNIYKSVSSLKITKEDRGMKHILGLTLRTLELTMAPVLASPPDKLRAVLSNLTPSKAAGPDKINPRLPGYLGPTEVSFPRQNFHKSGESTSIPQGWRVADIRPVTKSGKDPKSCKATVQSL